MVHLFENVYHNCGMDSGSNIIVELHNLAGQYYILATYDLGFIREDLQSIF